MTKWFCKWEGGWIRDREVDNHAFWERGWVVEAGSRLVAALAFSMEFNKNHVKPIDAPDMLLISQIETTDLTDVEWCIETCTNRDLSLSYYLIPYFLRQDFFAWAEMDELSVTDFKNYEINLRTFAFKNVRTFTEVDKLKPLIL